PGVLVSGGPQAAAGNWQGGATTVFGGDTGGFLAYQMENGAHLSIRDTFIDGGSQSTTAASVSGNGAFTWASSLFCLTNPSNPVISFNNFHGVAAFMGAYMYGCGNNNIAITGDGTGGKFLALGITNVSVTPNWFTDTTSPADTMEFLNSI